MPLLNLACIYFYLTRRVGPNSKARITLNKILSSLAGDSLKYKASRFAEF